ncbi:hypothetical protein Moror_16938 [Moniliophthora roreri MCA 2997]|uniref:Uncharacterized protein n=1 Tax=Moniliophthora roreri (strain MCA 2997) TaxID=1381753 RepID=V2WS52_MONRO|nr:hypothetical protein Moror_16938 [Moniliophthora roreri MCA 2997]
MSTSANQNAVYLPGASLSPVPSYPDEIVYSEPFSPSTYKLLYILNCKHYDENLMRMMENSEHQHHWVAMGTLMYLRRHRRLLDEAIARTDREAGLFTRTLTEGDDRVVLDGPITVPSLPNDVKNLPLYLDPPQTGAEGDSFPRDEDLNPNTPAFLIATNRHQRRMRRAREIARGQFILQSYCYVTCAATSTTPQNPKAMKSF